MKLTCLLILTCLVVSAGCGESGGDLDGDGIPDGNAGGAGGDAGGAGGNAGGAGGNAGAGGVGGMGGEIGDPLPTCGNGVVDEGEACDDGNLVNVDFCDATCTKENCVVGVSHPTIQKAVDDPMCEQIALPPGTYSENVRIPRNLSIVGAGARASIVNGDDIGRPFEVGRANVRFTSLQMTNGSASEGGGLFTEGDTTLTDVIVTQNSATQLGGGIYNDGGNLTIVESQVDSNSTIVELLGAKTTRTAPLLYAGGGIYGAGGSVTVSDSRITANEAASGGGLAAMQTKVTIDRASRIANNDAIGDDRGSAAGGGLYLDDCDTIISSAGIEFNTAQAPDTAEGGGISASLGTLELSDATIAGNRAGGQDSDAGEGGGLQLVEVTTTITNDTVIDNNRVRGKDSAGAGIHASEGTLSVAHSSVTNNVSFGEISDEDSRGGGLWLSDCPTTVLDTVISNNGSGRGAGLYISGAAAVLTRVTLAFNEAVGSGGGLMAEALSGQTLDMILDRCTLEGNVAGSADTHSGSGGAISAHSSSGSKVAILLQDSTLADNQVIATDLARGGGIHLNAGFDDATAELIAVNSTLTGNAAMVTGVSTDGQGGAASLEASFDFARSRLELYNTTVAFNSVAGDFPAGAAFHLSTFQDDSTSEVVIGNSIVSYNTGADQCLLDPTGAALTSAGYNVLGADFGCTIGGDSTGNLLNVDPRLRPLADNGGPTQTHAITTDSPAFGAGNPDGCQDHQGVALTSDQRGSARPTSVRIGICDAGAFEIQGIRPPPDIAQL